MDDRFSKMGIQKSVMYAGSGDIPSFSDGSRITFHFQTQTLDENGEPKDIIDDSKTHKRPMELIVGKKFKLEVWETCLTTMRIGEVAIFKVKRNLVDAYPLVSKGYREFAGLSKPERGHCCGMMAYSEGIGHPDLNMLIKEPTDLQFILELVKVENPGEYEKQAWVMNPEEKLETVPKLKEEGNRLYKLKNYEHASQKYAQALGMLEQLMLREKPGDTEFSNLENQKFLILSNFAQCKLLLKDYYPVIEHTTEILEKDKDNVKALYRRAKAFTAVWDLEAAKKDFEKLAEIDPSFKNQVHRELKNIASLQKEKDDDIRAKLCGKVFTKT